MRIKIVILIMFGTTLLFGQLYEENKKLRLGIKTAINISTMYGSEFKNPRPKFGYTAGAYLRAQMGKSFHFHTEIIGNFRGSNFANQTNEYSKVSTFYLDVPLLLAYSLNDNSSNIMIGPQVSYLALSSLYIRGKSKAHINDIGLGPTDLAACLAYQRNFNNIGLQVALKVGVIDINRDIKFEGVNPLTGYSRSIRNAFLELGLLF